MNELEVQRRPEPPARGGDSRYAGNDSQLALGQFDKAIADFTDALHRDPKDATAYSRRGRAWASQKEFSKAIADDKAALDIDAGNPLAYMGLGRVSQAEREFDRAIAYYQKAIGLDRRMPRPSLIWPTLSRGERPVRRRDQVRQRSHSPRFATPPGLSRSRLGPGKPRGTWRGRLPTTTKCSVLIRATRRPTRAAASCIAR